MADDGIAFSLQLAGFVSSGAFLGAAVSLNLALLYGTYCYPRAVGLFVVVPYVTYTRVLGRRELGLGARWDAFSRNFLLLRILRRYMRLTVVVHDDLRKGRAKRSGSKTLTKGKEPKDQNYLFAVFPHGTNSDYRILMDGLMDTIFDSENQDSNARPLSVSKVRTLAASILFRIPLVREISLWTGCVDARRSVAEKLLAASYSVLVLPGGQDEQIRTQRGVEQVYLQRRKGFVKLALRYQVPLVPVYVFGASDLYYTSNRWSHVRLWMVKNLGISIPLCWGQWGSPLCPLPVPTTIVFGKPIQVRDMVQTAGSPTHEEVEKVHTIFTEALMELFDKHKEKLGYGDRALKIL